MTYNQKKHHNLLFHRYVDVIFQQPLSKTFVKFKEGGSSHLKHLDNLYIGKFEDAF